MSRTPHPSSSDSTGNNGIFSENMQNLNDGSAFQAPSFGEQNKFTIQQSTHHSPASSFLPDVCVNDRTSMHLDHVLSSTEVINTDSEWLLPNPQRGYPWHRMDVEPENFQSLFVPLLPSTIDPAYDSGSLLSPDEQRAMEHFANTFSQKQTTRDTQWSVPSLLVRHAVKNSPLLLEVILAVSLFDLNITSDPYNSSHALRIAHQHYETGTQKLVEALKFEDSTDRIGILGAFYCIYSYMLRQELIDSMKLDRLSSTALKFLRKNELEIISLKTGPQCLDRNERSLLARMSLWLIKIDAQCSLLGCEANIIGYYQANPEILSCLQAASRLALQHNWGAEYPISQSIRDIESCLPMDMMMDLLIIWYKIAELCRNLEKHDQPVDISKLDRRLDFLEVKYQQVFYYGSSNMTLQPALKLNCAVAATMFYASRIYLKRAMSTFGASGPPEIAYALSQLLVFAQLICATGLDQPVYEFQWSLFIAAVETNDKIHREWLNSKITDTRFKYVLQRIFAIQGSGTKGIDLGILRGMLQGSL
ncbi:hypothetical protein ACMFMG_000331 [Clarireedia jacksonii]